MTKICECDKSDVHSSLRPAGATYCTDGVKYGVEESIPPHAKFHPISPGVGAWEPKTENFMRFWNFSALTLLVGQQEGHLGCKKYGGWRRWALVSPDGGASTIHQLTQVVPEKGP